MRDAADAARDAAAKGATCARLDRVASIKALVARRFGRATPILNPDCMRVSIREATSDEIGALFPLLALAEPSESALRWGLENLSDAVYRMDVDGTPVAAATMRWKGHPCELHELGVEPARQGEGLGRAFVMWLIEEARRRGKRAMIVGTTNTATGNILFYQKCGFRIEAVRKDYFWYYRPPRFERGVRVLDMLLFRREIDVVAGTPRRRPPR